MTLNITLVTPQYIIQASDRRGVSWDGVNKGQPCDDEANKGLVLQADDGIFAITFTGIASCNGQRTDLRLAEGMLDEGVPELPVRQGINIIARLATKWFRTFPTSLDKRHTFVIGGWERSRTKPRAALWTVTNYVAEDGRTPLDSAKDVFDVQKHAIRPSGGFLLLSGQHDAVSRNDRKRLEAALRAGAHPDRLEMALVDTVRAAASKAKWANMINGNVLAILLAPRGEVRASHYPSSGNVSRYIPLFAWYEAGRNYVSGDGWTFGSGTQGYQFGPSMFVRPPSIPAMIPEAKVKFLFRMTEAKHKREPVGDVSIVRIIEKPQQEWSIPQSIDTNAK